MKYNIGDKVKYDDGEWLVYGTIIAVYKHSDYPFYRLNIERKEKKRGEFAVNQFETELEIWEEETVSSVESRKWENLEIEYLSKALRRSPQEVEKKIEEILPTAKKETQGTVKPKVETKVKPVAKPKTKVKPKKVLPKKVLSKKVLPKKEKAVELLEDKPGKTMSWYDKLEMFRKGEKSGKLGVWESQNRKDFRDGKLSEEKIQKLQEASFSFDAKRKI